MSEPWTEAAIRIARHIQRGARQDEVGVWWPSGGQSERRLPEHHRSPGLWGGAAGISLFFVSLFEVTGEAAHRENAERGLAWSINALDRLDERRRGAFLTGGTGVVYALCRLWDATGEDELLARARDLALNLLEPPRRWNSCDLASGVAGAVLALAHLEARGADSRVVDLRRELVRTLVGRLRPHRTGVFWNLTPGARLPLCGMAHGNSGIAFVLTELASAAGHGPDHPLVAVVDAALAYEDRFYDEDQQNWPDHRLPLDAGEDGERYGNAWCHGAAGIGLARLGTPEIGLSGQDRFLEGALARTRGDIRSVLDRGVSWLTFTICHGLAGLAELPLHVGGEAREAAEAVGRGALGQLREMGGVLSGQERPDVEDHSLFVGSAGVGHFLLRLEHGDRVPSIARPSLPAEARIEPVRVERIRSALRSGLFPRTCRILGFADAGDDGGEPTAGPLLSDRPVPEAVRDGLEADLDRLEEEPAERAGDLLELEWAHLEAVRAVEDFRALPDPTGESGGDPDDPAEDRRELVLLPGLALHRSRWSWSGDVEEAWERNLAASPDGHGVLLIPGPNGGAESWLDERARRTLVVFREPAAPAKVLAGATDHEEREARRGHLTALLRAGLLREVAEGDR